MNEGVLFTSGRAMLALGPNNNGNIGYVNTLPGHPLLDEVYNAPSRDVSGIDFSFTATNDLLLCKIIFGSEEYPEALLYWYEGFGFFISGAGYGGNFYPDTNIANIPNTDIPINVHTVNNVFPSYPQYYVDNTNGQFIQYDGFTVPIEFYCYVLQDSIYNTNILTGDYSDRYYDSGIFVEKNSFRCVNSTDLLEFCFKEMFNPALTEDIYGIITNDSVLIFVPYATEISSLTASFKKYIGTSVYIGSAIQLSDTTINDFTEPVIYNLIAGNGNNKDWTVVIDFLPNSENEILEYKFLVENNPNLPWDISCEIVENAITADVPIGTDLSSLIATFTLSDYATAFVNGIPQQSGVTANNFYNAVNYQIEAENGDINNYSVSVIMTGTKSISINFGFFIYPNPATEHIIVTIDNALNEESFVSIFDIKGQQVIQHNFQNHKRIEIDVSNLPKGVYLMKILTKEGMEVKKLLIQ